MGVQVPQGQGAIFGVVRPIEKQGTQQKSITASARLLQPTALLPPDRCHIYFPRRCSLWSKFFDCVFLLYGQEIEEWVFSKTFDGRVSLSRPPAALSSSTVFNSDHCVPPFTWLAVYYTFFLLQLSISSYTECYLTLPFIIIKIILWCIQSAI